MTRMTLAILTALALVVFGCSPPENNGVPDTNNGEADAGSEDAGGDEEDEDTGGDGEEDATDGDPDMTAGGCNLDGCPSDQSCNRATGECVDCITDNECGSNGTCDSTTNTCMCEDGFHDCDAACVDDTDVATCGDRCDPCPDGDNGTPACVNGTCTLACEQGYILDDDGMNCVGCVDTSDCTDPEASVCDGGMCVGCSTAADCSHIPDTGVCNDDGVCVECSFDDDSACGENSCDVLAGTCTQTPKMSVSTCNPCVATSECMGIDVCVPMQFNGMDRDSHYCLPLDPGTCDAPYPNSRSVTTIGGASADVCYLNEDLTTCEAVLDYGAGCSDASDCGVDGFDDALCEPIEFGPAACTIPCSGIDSMECPNEENFYTCATGDPGEMWCGAY